MEICTPQALAQPPLARKGKEKQQREQPPDKHSSRCCSIMLMLSQPWMRLRPALFTLFSLWRTLKLRPKHKHIRQAFDDFWLQHVVPFWDCWVHKCNLTKTSRCCRNTVIGTRGGRCSAVQDCQSEIIQPRQPGLTSWWCQKDVMEILDFIYGYRQQRFCL